MRGIVFWILILGLSLEVRGTAESDCLVLLETTIGRQIGQESPRQQDVVNAVKAGPENSVLLMSWIHDRLVYEKDLPTVPADIPVETYPEYNSVRAVYVGEKPRILTSFLFSGHRDDLAMIPTHPDLQRYDLAGFQIFQPLPPEKSEPRIVRSLISGENAAREVVRNLFTQSAEYVLIESSNPENNMYAVSADFYELTRHYSPEKGRRIDVSLDDFSAEFERISLAASTEMAELRVAVPEKGFFYVLGPQSFSDMLIALRGNQALWYIVNNADPMPIVRRVKSAPYLRAPGVFRVTLTQFVFAGKKFFGAGGTCCLSAENPAVVIMKGRKPTPMFVGFDPAFVMDSNVSELIGIYRRALRIQEDETLPKPAVKELAKLASGEIFTSLSAVFVNRHELNQRRRDKLASGVETLTEAHKAGKSIVIREVRGSKKGLLMVLIPVWQETP